MSNLRPVANSARDFLVVVLDMLIGGAIIAGDIVVLDNASIHYAAGIAAALDALFDLAGARLVFLPAYSPELNPCELVFAQAKRYLRERRGSLPFAFEIIKAFALVTHENVRSYHQKCTFS